MAHIHPLTDTDTHFIIDGTTRHVKNATETKAMLVQYDHNSERFTFDVPRYVDKHDLSLCNVVRVHYINIDKAKRTEHRGIYEVTDLRVCPDDDKIVECSWEISGQATQLVGALYFVVQFACMENDKIVYSWNTARHTGVTIAEGIDNGAETEEEYEDILTKWEKMLKEGQIAKLEQTTASTEDGGENVWTATLADGRKSELRVRNGSRGLLGSVRTITGDPLKFFVGSDAKYKQLSEEAQQDLYAIIDDDTTLDDICEDIADLKRSRDEQIIYSGTTGIMSSLTVNAEGQMYTVIDLKPWHIYFIEVELLDDAGHTATSTSPASCCLYMTNRTGIVNSSCFPMFLSGNNQVFSLRYNTENKELTMIQHSSTSPNLWRFGIRYSAIPIPQAQ